MFKRKKVATYFGYIHLVNECTGEERRIPIWKSIPPTKKPNLDKRLNKIVRSIKRGTIGSEYSQSAEECNSKA